MKTVTDGNKILRATDEEASKMVAQGWAYCPKLLWKTEVRDQNVEKSDKAKGQK